MQSIKTVFLLPYRVIICDQVSSEWLCFQSKAEIRLKRTKSQVPKTFSGLHLARSPSIKKRVKRVLKRLKNRLQGLIYNRYQERYTPTYPFDGSDLISRYIYLGWRGTFSDRLSKFSTLFFRPRDKKFSDRHNFRRIAKFFFDARHNVESDFIKTHSFLSKKTSCFLFDFILETHLL